MLSSISAGKQEATFQDLNIDLQDSISVMGVKEPNVIGCRVIDKDSRDVSKFLNRILGLRVEKQNLVRIIIITSYTSAIHNKRLNALHSCALVIGPRTFF